MNGPVVDVSWLLGSKFSSGHSHLPFPRCVLGQGVPEEHSLATNDTSAPVLLYVCVPLRRAATNFFPGLSMTAQGLGLDISKLKIQLQDMDNREERIMFVV